MDQPTKTVILGSESDNQLIKRVKQALRDVGASRQSSSWGVGGSQEVTREEWRVGDERLALEGETYIGLSLTGPHDLVTQIAAQIVEGG